VDLIALGIGDPDLPTPVPIVETLAEAARDPATHQYPLGAGLPQLRRAVADYYVRRFGVKLDPDTEVTTLIGSKEGVAHVAGALVDPGQVVAFPDPGYPVYEGGTIFAGGRPHRYEVNEDNEFLPDFSKLPASVLSRFKLLWINYPNAPTGAVAPKSYFKKIAALAKRHGFLVCSDAAYADIYYDGKRPESFLSAPGAKSVGIEFYSCSKSFNMTGWRLAFAVGNRQMIAALRAYKNNCDSGVFSAVQRAGVVAFDNAEAFTAANNRLYQGRRDRLVEGLRSLGWRPIEPAATFFVWVPTPGGADSMELFRRLLDRCGVVTTPGFGLGRKSGKYLRFALTTSEARIGEAVERMRAAGF
jgi:LL-diaminopimelate aminotransferase